MKPSFVKLLSIFLFFFILVTTNQSCKKVKEDVQVKNEAQTVKHPLEDQFFVIADSVPDVIKKVAAYIQSRKNKSTIVTNVINEVGLPLWDKALISTGTTKKLPVSGGAERGNSFTDTNNIFIPIVSDGTTEINAVFACKVTGDSVLKVNFLKEKDYIKYGFNDNQLYNANKLIGLMMYVQNKVFGTESFVLNDGRLFSNNGLYDSSQKKLIRFKAIDNIQSKISEKGNDYFNGRFVSIDFCYETTCNCGELGNGGITTTTHCNSFYFWVNESYININQSVENIQPVDNGLSGSGGFYYGSTSTQTLLQQQLNLNDSQLSFLNYYSQLSEETYNYITNIDGILTDTEKKVLAKSHIEYFMESSLYLNFCITKNQLFYSLNGWTIPWFHQASLGVDNPDLYVNIQILKLNLQQAYYLWNNSSINSQVSQYLTTNNQNAVSKILIKSSLEIAIKGQPFQLPQIWIDYPNNNNVNRIIVNLLENKCLEQVFSTITNEKYSNKLSEMIREFDANENVTIILREDKTLDSDTYGECRGILDEQNNVKFYLITLNPTALAGSSEEFIGDTFFHEFIHGYLKNHYGTFDFENISDHTEMLASYLDRMASALNSVFGTSLIDSYCIAYSGLLSNNDTDPLIGQILSNQVKELVRQKLLLRFQNAVFQDDNSITQRANDYGKNGSKGKRTGNCQ